MERPSDVIRSRSNPLVRRLRALKKEAEEELALVEGIKLLGEAAAAGMTVVEVAATPRALETPRCRQVVEALRAGGTAVRAVAEDVLASLSEVETSQGVLALARRPSFDEDRMFRGTPLIVVAVGVQNPGNLGALLRTAEAAGATGAYLTKGTADPLSWKALRGSMGSAFRLPHIRGLSARSVLERLTSRGVATVATSAAAEKRYDEADFGRPVALLFGNEGAGLPDAVAAAADLRVAIPMTGAVESLNIGVAAGILLFEAARQRRGRP
jgi:TrmH family RNA methyltransferase